MNRADIIVRKVLATVMGGAVSVLLLASAPLTEKVQPKQPPAPLPRMVDLGAGKCIPCKKMAPIIKEMQFDYAAIVDIVFVDVWKDPKAGAPYKIRLIPTQVFFDRDGREVYRHEGSMSREEIEKIFQERLGVTPVKPAAKVVKPEVGARVSPGHNALG